MNRKRKVEIRTPRGKAILKQVNEDPERLRKGKAYIEWLRKTYKEV